MGLCKCPRHKVTNLFCFEHKVNVCEECLVNEHYSCMVRSYLQWLQDSDYTSVCPLCQDSIQNSSKGKCVRLLCLDVFHWTCLDTFLSSLPPNTTPAGYECPACRQCVFPKSNQAGPVTDILKSFLEQSSWGRGTILPEPNGVESKHKSHPYIEQQDDNNTSIQRDFTTITDIKTNNAQRVRFDPIPPPSQVSVFKQNSSELSSENGTNFQANPVPDARWSYNFSQASSSLNMPNVRDKSCDYDENKYARRPAFTWLARWIKTYFPAQRSPYSVYQRHRRYLLIIFLLLAFTLSLFLMASYGRQMADEDPMLDLRNNPDIIIQRDVPALNPEMNGKMNDVQQMQLVNQGARPLADSDVIHKEHVIHDARDVGI